MSKEAVESALPEVPTGTVAPADEPPGAFIYVPPSPEFRERYRHIFELAEPLPDRFFKTQFDRLCAIAALVLTAPAFALLYVANLLEGLAIGSHRGDFIISYRAVSRGRVFDKYKIRTLKTAAIDPAAAKAGDWRGFANEWNPGSLTFTGSVVKKFYLDELPQLFNILRGDIGMVGPRPLAQHHYERDLAQGNVVRRLIKAGLLGPNQALKGTDRFGDAAVEYDYVEKYMTLGPFALLWQDLVIIGRCLKVMAEARGL